MSIKEKIELQKKKLNEMIEAGKNYEEILAQSHKIDELINVYMRRLH